MKDLISESIGSAGIIKRQEGKETFDLIPEDIKKKFDAIHKFQFLVKENLHRDHDFGIIPGTEKPTLLKPGAEKIIKLLNLHDDYIPLTEIQDWDKPFFHYEIKCELREISSCLLISSGLGSCNSKESKYRWRWIAEWDLTAEQKALKESVLFKEKRYKNKEGKFKVYRFENDDIFSQVNTILKMAKKRALVDAALSAGRLSDLFTQDLEDIREEIAEEKLGEIVNEKKIESKIEIVVGGKKYRLFREDIKKHFDLAEKNLGKEVYLAILGQAGYESFDQISDEKLADVYTELVKDYKERVKK